MSCLHEILDYPDVILDIIVSYLELHQVWAGLHMDDRIIFYCNGYTPPVDMFDDTNTFQWLVKGSGVYYTSILNNNRVILRRFDIITSKVCRVSLKDRFNGSLGLFRNQVCVIGCTNPSNKVYMLTYGEPYVTYTQLPSMRYKRLYPVCAWNYSTLYVIDTTIEVFDGVNWNLFPFREKRFAGLKPAQLPPGRKSVVVYKNTLIIVGHTSWNKTDGYNCYGYMLDVTTRVLKWIVSPPNYDPTAKLVILNNDVYCVNPRKHASVLGGTVYRLDLDLPWWFYHPLNIQIHQRIVFPWPTYTVDVT